MKAYTLRLGHALGISLSTVYWIDVFVRDIYFNEVIESLKHCQKDKGLEIFAYCIMSSHIHLIFRAQENNPGEVLKSFKQFYNKFSKFKN